MKTFEITLYVRTSEYAEVTITAEDEHEAIEQVEDMFRAGEISFQPTMYMSDPEFEVSEKK